jgi:Spy/CpxP family protein refolding chaperone
MSQIVYIDWQNDDFNWESEQRRWQEVYIIIDDLLGGGARDPQAWGDHPFDLVDDQQRINEIRDQLQQNLDRMSQQNKNKLIEVLILMGDASVADKKKTNKDIKITVENVQTIAKQLRVEITDFKE